MSSFKRSAHTDGVPKARQSKGSTLTAVARRRLRKLLHADLDKLLNGTTTEDDGTVMTVLDSMTLRAVAGYGFNVRVHSLHPDQTTRLEAPGTVSPGPQVGLIRDP